MTGPGPFSASHPHSEAGRQSRLAGEKQAQRWSYAGWWPQQASDPCLLLTLSTSDSDIIVSQPEGRDKLCPLHRFHQGPGRVNLDVSFESNPLCFFQTSLVRFREGGNGRLTSPTKDKWLYSISWPPSGWTPADQAADCMRQHISSSDPVEQAAALLRRCKEGGTGTRAGLPGLQKKHSSSCRHPAAIYGNGSVNEENSFEGKRNGHGKTPLCPLSRGASRGDTCQRGDRLQPLA